jgi:dipeptidyl aminopeptidase/acylaminoacyl peptidase
MSGLIRLAPMHRRYFISLAFANSLHGQKAVSKPFVSEEACPLLVIAPVATDGFRGHGFLRKPPGSGRFPAIVWLHGGLITQRTELLASYARGVNASRFLAAGYVVAVPTYRSRDVDPQSPVSREDSLAAVEYVKGLSYVDPSSVVVYGCSGGGDLALEVAAAADVACIVAEEPASLLMAGILNAKSPKRGERFTPGDARPIMDDPKQYYTPEYQRMLKTKISRIRCPILVLQGNEDRPEPPINRFNARVLLPELRAAGKSLEVMTYPGEQHCFCFVGAGPDHDAVLKAFGDMDSFARRYISTKPTPIDSALIKQIAL